MEEALLQGKRVALLATDEFEDSELMEPLEAIKGAGAEVDIISIKDGSIVGKHATKVDVTKLVDDAISSDYDALVLPGGVANPDVLRMNSTAVEFVHSFFDADKPVGAICHAPWMLIEAGVAQGRTLTSWPSLKTDLVNAGANWVDEEVVVDGNLTTSRKPDDLPAFCDRIIEEFASYRGPVLAAY